MAKYLDENGLLYFKNKLDTKFTEKVDKVDGKGLSANDYTTDEKTKLAGIESGANKTTVNNTLTSTSTAEALSAAQGKALNDRIDDVVESMGDLGYGDMMKATYDTNGNGVVDNAEKLGGQFPAWYAPASHVSDTAVHITSAERTNWGAAYTHSQTAHAPSGAQANVIESVKVNGTAQTVTGKSVDITVPTTVASLSDAGSYALKSDLTNVYKYQGSVAAAADLPAAATAGDVYNVTADGMNYAWTGTEWDALGAAFSIASITNAEIDVLFTPSGGGLGQ